MTNRELLGRFNAIQQAIQSEPFDTTKINYALSQNLKRLERALEPFEEEEEKLREEYSDLLERAQEIREDAEDPRAVEFPDAFDDEDRKGEWEDYKQRREELLDIEADEEMEPYQVDVDWLLEHEEEAPARWLTTLDWMFVDEIKQ